MRQLRLRAFGRMFRRLQRSVTLTPAQRAAITRRQEAVGIARPRRKSSTVPPSGASAAAASSTSGPDLNASTLSAIANSADYGVDHGAVEDSLRLDESRGSLLSQQQQQHLHLQLQRRQQLEPRAGGVAHGSVVTSQAKASLCFADVKDDDDYVSVESEDDDNEKDSADGVLVCSRAWFGVLHPEVEDAIVPALTPFADDQLNFQRFAEILSQHMDATRPSPSIYLLTKVALPHGSTEQAPLPRPLPLHPVLRPQSRPGIVLNIAQHPFRSDAHLLTNIPERCVRVSCVFVRLFRPRRSRERSSC